MKETPPKAATHPHTFAWFILVNRFTDAARATWGGAQAAPAKGGAAKQAAPAKAAPAKKEEEPKKAAAADDDFDLFGDDGDDAVSWFSIAFSFVRTTYLIGNLIN